MTGAYRGGLSLSNGLVYGQNVASTMGLSVPGSTTTTFAKGAWTQFTASTTTDSSWIKVFAESGSAAGAAFAVDIGIGSIGNEIALIPNLNFSAVANYAGQYYLPLMIPSGTRLVGRMSSNVTSDTLQVQVIVFSDTYGSVGAGSAVDTFGFSNTLNLGTQLDPGAAANTNGAYVQITSSLTHDISGFIICFDTQGATTGSVGQVTWLADISVGASGSEQQVIGGMLVFGQQSANTSYLFAGTTPYYAIPIPAGTRVAARVRCSTGTSPDRLIGFTFYGVRL